MTAGLALAVIATKYRLYMRRYTRNTVMLDNDQTKEVWNWKLHLGDFEAYLTCDCESTTFAVAEWLTTDKRYALVSVRFWEGNECIQLRKQLALVVPWLSTAVR